ncbi:tellurite resistance TerB family protein [Insolitispirillum peregrinum]|uniref:tellurite resistance TerB family protein n=1 Tax=Insolitispirillum peregrinum TaxID=80876 RepID=UPI003620440F
MTTAHHAALIHTMVMIAACDGDLNNTELRTIDALVHSLPVFRDYKVDHLDADAAACAQLMADEDGLEQALEQIVNGLPEKLTETAYLVACEVAAADHALQQEELRLLEILRHRLGIDRLHAAAIERGVRARFATL